MTAAVDANIIIHASDSGSPYRSGALAFLERRTAAPDLLYLFWPTIMAYARIVTHPRILRDPLTLEEAAGNIGGLLALPNVRSPAEGERFWEMWGAVTREAGVRGNLVPDAHVVALMREHGVGTMYTRDRGMRRFEGIRVVDPFDEGE